MPGKYKFSDMINNAVLRSCVSVLRHPGIFCRYQKDYWSYRRKNAALFAPDPSREEKSGKVIFIGIHNSIPSAKEEGIYSRILNMHGCTPVCLVSRGSPLVKYYKLYGVKNYEIFEDLTDRFDLTPFVDEMERVLAERPSYRDLIYY
ncbi:MAG: hypothetical protein HOC91_09625, partial [Nitrospinaceae bacterium]|nr:hypothetical protein [Nitrospinaceae bacterium]